MKRRTMSPAMQAYWAGSISGIHMQAAREGLTQTAKEPRYAGIGMVEISALAQHQGITMKEAAEQIRAERLAEQAGA